MFLPSMLNGNVTFQEILVSSLLIKVTFINNVVFDIENVLRQERSVAILARPIDSLRRLEEVPHVMLASKTWDCFRFLFPSFVLMSRIFFWVSALMCWCPLGFC